jgi:hypothetical protein
MSISLFTFLEHTAVECAVLNHTNLPTFVMELCG